MTFGVLASYLIAGVSNVTIFLADPSPSPVPGEFTGDENAVTPGVVGFIATAFIAVMTVLLLVDMTRRVRKVRYRAEVQEKLAAESTGTEKVTEAPEG